MSKFMRIMITRKFAIAFASIFILFFAFWAIGATQNYVTKKRVENAYTRIIFPSSFNLQSKKWVNGSTDVNAHWSYAYISTSSRVETISKIKNVFLQANYKVNEIGGGDINARSGKVLFIIYVGPATPSSASFGDPLYDLPPQRVNMEGNDDG